MSLFDLPDPVVGVFILSSHNKIHDTHTLFPLALTFEFYPSHVTDVPWTGMCTAGFGNSTRLLLHVSGRWRSPPRTVPHGPSWSSSVLYVAVASHVDTMRDVPHGPHQFCMSLAHPLNRQKKMLQGIGLRKYRTIVIIKLTTEVLETVFANVPPRPHDPLSCMYTGASVIATQPDIL